MKPVIITLLLMTPWNLPVKPHKNNQADHHVVPPDLGALILLCTPQGAYRSHLLTNR